VSAHEVTPVSRETLEENAEREIMLGLLAAVEDDARVTQRSLADRLGVALGLTNAYLKRCVKKGWIKVHEIPARRYAYYLTPTGFAEKSRLTAQFLSSSFSFFRRAREDCSQCLRHAKASGWQRVLLFGGGELAEIASISAAEAGVELVGVVVPGSNQKQIAGLPVFQSAEEAGDYDVVLMTDISQPQETYDALCDYIEVDRILCPDLLKISITWPDEMARVRRGASQ